MSNDQNLAELAVNVTVNNCRVERKRVRSDVSLSQFGRVVPSYYPISA